MYSLFCESAWVIARVMSPLRSEGGLEEGGVVGPRGGVGLGIEDFSSVLPQKLFPLATFFLGSLTPVYIRRGGLPIKK
jgi:hypothetical protein